MIETAGLVNAGDPAASPRCGDGLRQLSPDVRLLNHFEKNF
jgi:hypothetical protein